MGCGNSEQVTNVFGEEYHSTIKCWSISSGDLDSELAMEEAGQRVDFDGNVVSLYDRKENRPEESGDFKPVENIEGEEFLAVRPWLG